MRIFYKAPAPGPSMIVAIPGDVWQVPACEISHLGVTPNISIFHPFTV